MNKTKRMLSLLTSVTMAASAFSAFVIPASAKTDVYGPLTWEEATETGFADLGRGATSLVADFEGNQGNCVLMNNSGGERGSVQHTLDSAVEAAHVGVSYDVYFTSEDTYLKYVAVGNNTIDRMNKNAVNTAGIVFYVGNNSEGNIMVNGSVDTGITPDQWITVDGVVDFLTKKIDVTITPETGSVYETAVDFVDSAVTDISRITLNSNRGRADFMAIYFDNFTVSTFEEPSITVSGESVTVETSSSATIATVEDAESVNVTSDDEGVVTASYSSETGQVTAQYVGDGKTTVTIVATSSDGVSVEKTVDVIAGDVQLAAVDVRYVYDNAGEKTEIATGYQITDVPVGTQFTITDIRYEETISTNDYRYSSPAVEGTTFTVGESDNVLYVVYADRDAAVNTIAVSYKSDGGEVASESVEIGTGYYEGDQYTFISNSYVEDSNGIIYAVADDYTEDVEYTQLNNSTTPVNSVLEKSVTLSSPTTIEYDVKESTNADFYAEWEDIFEAAGGEYSTSRYVASGGMMYASNTVKAFYDVEATGYYQIVITGGPKRRGIAVFRSEADAQAATAVDDQNAVLSLTPADNNDAIGFYTAKTVLLSEGDQLVIKGFGDNGFTDNLDYVVVRRIVTGDIIGADGVSIIPGGQTSEFTFDSGLDIAPTWSVTGVEGVTIDQNGVLTVSENAKSGTATVTASIEGAEVSGSKTVTIADAVVTDAVLNGPGSVSNGSENTYSVSNVIDQFGEDITSVANVSYESTVPTVMTIDPATGVANVIAIGETVVKATVTVGESSKVFEKTITAENYYIVGDATGDTTTVNSDGIAESDNITGYLVTTSNNGVLVSQTTAEELPSTVNTAGADKYEIAPIYRYTSITSPTTGYELPDSFADGMYNITFKKNDTGRTDILVNGYMVGNNVDQYGEGRAISEPSEYTIHDAVVEGGAITVMTTDYSKGGTIAWVEVSKSPSIVDRKQKVYILGDSLVAEYYGTYDESTVVGGARSGWGQQIGNFFTDDVEVVNMANSGQYAKGLLDTAFPGVMAMAQPGDYFIIEAGYNDRSYSTREEMKASIIEMVEQCEAKGIRPVLVSPNASAHDYRIGLQYSSTMNDAAAELQTKYDDVIFVDLTKLSFDFMKSTGISRETAVESGNFYKVEKDANGVLTNIEVEEVEANGLLDMSGYNSDNFYYLWNSLIQPVEQTMSTEQVILTYNLEKVGGDTLHSSYVAAMKWAEIVAQGLYDNGAEFINTSYEYTFTDTIGNDITCKVEAAE